LHILRDRVDILAASSRRPIIILITKGSIPVAIDDII